MPLVNAIDTVVHLVDVGVVWSGDMNYGITCSRNQTMSSALCVRGLTYLMNKWMNEKIYIARLKAYTCMLNLPRLTKN